MALLRVVLLMAVLLFCISEVSSNAKVKDEMRQISQVAKSPNPNLVVRVGNRRLMSEIDCGGLCKDRCSLHSRPNRCIRACDTCCFRCKCVPPGTSGNREICGTCYTDMTTHGNQTKCP